MISSSLRSFGGVVLLAALEAESFVEPFALIHCHGHCGQHQNDECRSGNQHHEIMMPLPKIQHRSHCPAKAGLVVGLDFQSQLSLPSGNGVADRKARLTPVPNSSHFSPRGKYWLSPGGSKGFLRSAFTKVSLCIL